MHLHGDRRPDRRRRTAAPTLVVAGILAATGLSACGDDDTASAETPTLESYCEQLAAQPEGPGPFDEFFATYGDNPTLADAAEGLPAVAETIRAAAEDFAAIVPAAEVADAAADFLAAMEASAVTVDQGAAAAAAGDQEEFDRLEAENQDERVPAIFAAVDEITALCGAEM